MSIVLLILLGLMLNFSIAYLTAKDAQKRGHDKDKWFIISFVLGIFGIIIYLLTRNDREVPESERKPNRSLVRLCYIGSAVFGMIFLFVIALAIGPLLFPTPAFYDSCDRISVMDDPNPADSCEVSDERWDEVQEIRANRGTFEFLSGLSGIVLGPLFFYAIAHSG